MPSTMDHLCPCTALPVTFLSLQVHEPGLPCPHRTISVPISHRSGLVSDTMTKFVPPDPGLMPWYLCTMPFLGLTDHGVVALGEAGDEFVGVGFPGCCVNLFVSGIQLPKTDVLHDCRSKQDWLLGVGLSTGNSDFAPEGHVRRGYPGQTRTPRRAGRGSSKLQVK